MKKRSAKLALVALSLIVALFASSCDLLGLLDPSSKDSPSNDALLASLSVTGYALSPSFSANTNAYSVNVPTEITSVTLAASARHAEASLTGTGTKTLGAAGSATALSIVVTAEDGTTQKTYTVTVNRAAVAASDISTLSALSTVWAGLDIDPGFTTAFASDTLDYTLAAVGDYSLPSLLISATPTDANAVVSGTGLWTLAVGDNTRQIVVTAEDGVSQTTYSISAYLNGPESVVLTSFTVDSYNFGFDPDNDPMTTYTLNVPNGVASVSLGAAAEYSGSTLSYSVDGGNNFAPFSGSETVALTEGATTSIVIRVEAEFTSAMYQDYSINISRAALGASTDANLSLLTVNKDTSNIPLSPEFNSGTTSYTATVPSSYDGVTITAIATNSGASLANPGSVPLSPGENAFPILVTAEDGVTTKTYTVTITRLVAPTITITSPSASAEISTTTVTVSGSYSDPNGEIASIEVGIDPMNLTTTATITGSTWSVDLDWSALASGPKTIYVEANDVNHDSVVMNSIEVSFSAGLIGFSVTVQLALSSGTVPSGSYLYIFLINNESGIFGSLPAEEVSNSSFPGSWTIEGVPDLSEIGAVIAAIKDGPDLEAATIFMQLVEMDPPVTIDGADITLVDTIYLPPYE